MIEEYDICVCGHFAEDHHRSWFGTGSELPGVILVDECEWYGSNETGGMMMMMDGKWIDHCHLFRKAQP